MPKKVDHHARRTQIADALMRVAATRGLEAVSLRHVATEAGVSTGMVQHYFRDKDEMMLFALEVISERIGNRMAAELAELGDTPTPRALVRALLVNLLPLDESRLVEGHVGLAFYAYAVVKPAIAATLREDNERMRDLVADQILAARGPGDAGPISPVDAATGLFALVEGLSMQVLGRQYPPEVALAVFDAHLDLLFGPA